MAEIAGGAVRALLGVIGKEIDRLSAVGHDVQFIKEEMESMSSFLMHLARTTPPGREHDEQVRTWMKQVRELAQDCNNSIDRYLRYGDPAVYRARSSLGDLWLVWRVAWYFQRLNARCAAASELRELKSRARDVGERRQRYGVLVPSAKAKQEGGEVEAPQAPAETFGEDQVVAVTKRDTEEYGDEVYTSRRRALAFAEPRVLENCTEELLSWLLATKEEYKDKFPAIAIVAPDEENGVEVVNSALADPSMLGKPYHKTWISLEPKFQEPLKIFDLIKMSLGVKSDNTEKIKVHDNPIKEIEDKMEEHLRASTESSWAAPLDVLLDVLQELLRNLEQKHEKKQDEDKLSNEKMDKRGQHKLEEAAGKELPPSEHEKRQEEDTSNNEKMDKKGHQKLEEAAGKELPSEHEKKQEEDKSSKEKLVKDDNDKLEEAARKIQSYLELEGCEVHLDHLKYKSILKQLLPEPKEASKVEDKYQVAKRVREGQTSSKQQEDKWVMKLSEDQIEDKVRKTMGSLMANMLLQLLPKHDEGSGQLDEGPSHEEIKKKIKGALHDVRYQLLIEEKTAEIKKILLSSQNKEKTLLIIMDGATADLLEKWEEINCALIKMGCKPGSAAIVVTKEPGGDKYLNATTQAQGVPIKYSVVGYYCDKAERLTEGFVKEEQKSVFGEILKSCEPHEFCMKMFVCALYANPKRSMEELHKLVNELMHCGGRDDEEIKAYKMIKFLYDELPRDYKTCLLYLAIFPPPDDGKIIISRSRLVARWVVEGLVAGGDWSKSVRRAKQCFYELTSRWFLRPEDIGVTGKAKSCTVDKLVYNFIAEMAREEHVTDARLSNKFARHFSIGSDIRLRPSQSMEYFLSQRFSASSSSQFQLLKVLDLEGCESLKQKHLKNVCKWMILLKFLSLRDTGINRLPKEINKLQQLEVLDIRKTPHLGSDAIKDLKLIKLKHLLAGTRRTNNQEGEYFSTIQQMPIETGKMTALEVLSHVQVQVRRHHDWLPQILGQLWQLRKLGVVIYDCEAQLMNLLRGINDLHECLQSLSIEIQTIPKDDVRVCCWPSSNDAAQPTNRCAVGTPLRGPSVLPKPPRLLKSLRISGTPSYVEKNLLTLLANKDALAKLTLENTSLSQEDMKLLEKLVKLSSLNLRNVKVAGLADGQLTFKFGYKHHAFKALRYLAVKGGNTKKISFEEGTELRLEKIVWSFDSTEIEALSGIEYLDKLQEVELNGDISSDKVLKEAMDSISKKQIKGRPNINVKHNGKPLKLGQATGSSSATL